MAHVRLKSLRTRCLTLLALGGSLVASAGLWINTIRSAMTRQNASAGAARVPVVTNDEISDLGQAFNNMVNRIDTESRRREDLVKELKDSEERFRSVVNNSPTKIHIKDVEGRYVLVNSEAETLFGVTEEEAMGKTTHEIFPGRQADDFRAHDRAVLETGQVIEQEEQWELDDGVHTYLTVKFPIRDGDGEIVAIGAIGTDITERKRAEEALRESEVRLAKTAEMARVGYWVWDEIEDKAVYCSDELAEITGVATGRELAAMLTSLEKDLEWVHPDDRDRFGKTVRASMVEQRGYDIEFRIIRRDGEVRHLREILEPVLDDEGNLVRSNGIIQDITEQKQAEEQLRQAQKMQAVGYLTGGVAHEFNNMLAVIMGNMELLEERLGEDPESLRLVGSAMATSRRGARLTSQLLSFSRNQPLRPRLTDLDPLVADMSEVLESALGETIQVKLLLAGNLGRIKIDLDQMEAAILALAVNAHEAMPEGGTLTIETSQTCVDANQAASDPELTPGAYVALALSDTGVGMPLEDMASAFDPFFTTKGMATNSGLGLSMVHGFVKQSGGFVDLRSEFGGGTTVTLCFPVLEAEAKVQMCTLEGEAGHLSAGKQVLVVEDDPDLRKLVVCMLTKLGYGVSAAADGPTALSMMEDKAEFDLLFTDMVLPGGINGKELAEQARLRRPGLKILYTTGYEETAWVADDEPELAAALIRKPYRKAELAQELRRVLDA